MNILNLKEFQKKVEPELVFFFAEKIKQAKKFHTEYVKLILEAKNYTLNGGKRLRPYLIYLGYIAFGGKNLKEIIKASLCLELLHSYLLIHDDIIDNDIIRRGKATVHVKFTEYYQNNYYQKDPKHLGISQAIICGDLLASYAYEILIKSKFKTNIKLNALNKLNSITADVLAGELLDVNFSTKKIVSQKEILKVYEYKTARYTIEGPLHLGAILAGAEKQDLVKLSKYAIPAGMAFQLADDLLGLFADPKVSGKSNLSDLKQGTKTLPLNFALSLANKKNQVLIYHFLGHQDLSQAQGDKIRQIIKNSGAYELSLKKSNNLIFQAIKALNKISVHDNIKNQLRDLAYYIIKRKS